MITFHADDFGINAEQSKRILDCRKNGVLNSVSIIPNSRHLSETIPLIDSGCKIGIHINLAEGRCLADKDQIPYLADKNGFFKNSFMKLFLLSVVHRKDVIKQAETEVYEQIQAVLALLPDEYKIRIDSHIHYHMIPAVFCGFCRALMKTGREVEYIRYPVEKISVYLLNPDLLKDILPVNFIKMFVLNIFGIINKKCLKMYHLNGKTGIFAGVAFTGNMKYQSVKKTICLLHSKNNVHNKNMEVLFHPGGIKKGEELLDSQNRELVQFYYSDEHTQEAETLYRLREWI